MRELRIAPLRVAGEIELSLETDSQGKIVWIDIRPLSTVRGFETLVRGQDIAFVVPAVMRICGICHASHGAAICEAIEDTFGVRPPRAGLLLREACVLANRIQSHLIQVFLILPDLVRQDTVPQLQEESLKGLELSSSLLQTICGTATHPSHLVVGGLTQGLTDKARNKAIEILEELQEILERLAAGFKEALAEDSVVQLLREVRGPENYLATDPFYGSPTRLNPDDIIPQDPMGNTIPLHYSQEPVEVGPRARLRTFFGFDNPSLLGLQLARLKELGLASERIREILQEHDPQAPFRCGELLIKPGEGVGVIEAPRGILVHRVKLDEEGRILSLKIYTPTQFNLAFLREALKGAPAAVAEVALRIYDPCVPCAIH